MQSRCCTPSPPQGALWWPFHSHTHLSLLTAIPTCSSQQPPISSIILSFQEYMQYMTFLDWRFFTQYKNSLGIHLTCCVYQQFVAFYCCVVFSGECIRICLTLWAITNEAAPNFWCSVLSERKFSRINAWECNCWVVWQLHASFFLKKQQKYFLEWLGHFTLLSAGYE